MIGDAVDKIDIVLKYIFDINDNTILVPTIV